MGERSGYTAGWCDSPHWGIVTEGRLAIEWEDDVEILSKGDVFHCPAGPPGHRIEAADPATFIDLTPTAVLDGDGRLTDWRGRPLRRLHCHVTRHRLRWRMLTASGLCLWATLSSSTRLGHSGSSWSTVHTRACSTSPNFRPAQKDGLASSSRVR